MMIFPQCLLDKIVTQKPLRTANPNVSPNHFQRGDKVFFHVRERRIYHVLNEPSVFYGEFIQPTVNGHPHRTIMLYISQCNIWSIAMIANLQYTGSFPLMI